MNETITLIKRHGSVRRYKPDLVPQVLVGEIVRAAQQSSTSSNLQMYSVVAISDEDRKETMAQLCGDQDFIRQAPVFLAWCADLSRLERVSRRQGFQQVSRYVENFLLAAVDTAILMQSAALAAESLGLGICYVGAIRNNPREVIELLQLPDLVFPVAGMALGYPVMPPKIRPRLPLEAVLHWETYDSEGEVEMIAEYDRAMIATRIYKGRQVTNKHTADEEPVIYGWAEHSARRSSVPKRPYLRRILEEQGFHLE